MFSVFSGNKQYTNQPGCTDVPNHGAIPAGTYWIVDRPSGGLKSQTITFIKDIVTNVDHNSWFALYRDDGTVNDRTWINGIMRGQFRLHPIGPLGLSEGCVTFIPKTNSIVCELHCWNRKQPEFRERHYRHMGLSRWKAMKNLPCCSLTYWLLLGWQCWQ